MDWAQRMVFYAAMLGHFSSYHDGVSDEGTRSNPTDVGPSSYYGSGPYDYVPGLSMLLINQPLWSSCTQSQLASVTSLVAIKADGHIYKRPYDQISQWANNILPLDHTLPIDYYSTKKLIKNLGLPVKKIDSVKNGCILYRKDDVDLEYCKFCGDARYKPTRE
ncbi:UNVERIFIED_CONTAM: hypothetical protein Sradi_0014500 [Sesamum radiatum]|uniref:Uncharacterized protein n=1 Tax=Sesamum radiatum TaxID=300843 RepID=A0AAW2WLR5_SESRA